MYIVIIILVLIFTFSEKFNKLYTKSMNDNKIDNEEYNELIKIYEECMRDKKNKLSVF